MVSRDHAYADRRKGVFYPKMLHLSRNSRIITTDPICLIYIPRHRPLEDFSTAIVHSLVQRPVPNLSGNMPSSRDESEGTFKVEYNI